MKFTKQENPIGINNLQWWVTNSKDTIYLAEELSPSMQKPNEPRHLLTMLFVIFWWHYWNSISKKELNMLRFVLRRLDKAFSEKLVLLVQCIKTEPVASRDIWIGFLNTLLILLISQHV